VRLKTVPSDPAAHLISGFRIGTTDVADLLAEPLVVIEVGSGGRPAGFDVPVAFPSVVVAVARTSAPHMSAGDADVALTGVPDPPPPWVHVDDVEAAVDLLRARVEASPRAAFTLVGLLRAGRGRPIEEGLLLESLAYSMLQSGPEFARWLDRRGPVPDRAGSDSTVVVERIGDRLDLTLNRPEVHNAYDRQMRDELCQALAVPASDATLAVRLLGAGPSFCSGGDLNEFGTTPDPVSAHLIRTGRSPARLLAAIGTRGQAVIHGSCAGSGIELPAFTGHVQARPGTEMWLPELGMGLIPGAGGTVSLPARIGVARTAWMALSGQRIAADTALRWGLVDAIANPESRP
jgi:enoyl-CoA hydratase/carnithine racemase